MAFVSGIDKTKIPEIKQAEIHGKISNSIRKSGWLPNLFRNIVSKAKGVFKGKKRKAPTAQIKQTEQEISKRLDKLPDTLRGRLSRCADVYGNLPRI